jgi:uncharacterized protein (TIGR00661 family)
MKKKSILYAIQGTGNGHVARAREIIPILKKYGQIDILLSADQSHVDIGHEIQYRCAGLTFLYNKNGGISYWKTLIKNDPIQLIRDIWKLPVTAYDLVVVDFEFTAAWACRIRGVPSIALGHQAAFLSERTPRPPKRRWWGEWILKWYAPCERSLGFHFDQFDSFIKTPVIRSEVRSLRPEFKDHYSVYLPAFGCAELESVLSGFQNTQWEVFSRSISRSYHSGNVHFQSIDNDRFLESLRTCNGVLMSAGFEGPSEALFLGKKVCVLPIKGQYGQMCNAAALDSFGVHVLSDLSDTHMIQQWIDSPPIGRFDFPDQTEALVRRHIFDLDE